MSKKAQILNTALQLFIENGFEKTPTSMISKEAGVATGTLFHHFKTKEELIDALYLGVKTELYELMSAGFCSATTIEEKLRSIWEQLISWVLANNSKFQFLHQFKESPYISNVTKQKVEEVYAPFFQMITSGKEQGMFYDLPDELLIKITDAYVTASCQYFIEHPNEFDDPAVRENAFRSLWRALSKEG